MHDQVAAATAFLDWLTARGLTLGTCTQADFDQWLAGTSSHLVRSANFVRWAVARRHASGLTAPATRWTGPSGPLDQDRRWADARRLLHDGTYPAADRVAGLLVLLMDALVAGLAAGCRPHGSSLLGIPSPWLFPGRWPGRPLTEDALAQRLHALGISLRQGRSTEISAGDWAAYAAGISGRQR